MGVPLFHTHKKNYTFQFVVDKVQHKPSKYNATLLFLAGRALLAKLVLMSIPGYFIQTAMIPISVCEQIEGIVRRFVWGTSNEDNKMALVKWEACCQLLM